MTSTRARGMSSRSNSRGARDIQKRITAFQYNTFRLCNAKSGVQTTTSTVCSGGYFFFPVNVPDAMSPKATVPFMVSFSTVPV